MFQMNYDDNDFKMNDDGDETDDKLITLWENSFVKVKYYSCINA